MGHCEDCGTKLDGGTCPNCHEELYILETQSEWIDQPVSDDFAEKAQKQKEEREYNKRYRESL